MGGFPSLAAAVQAYDRATGKSINPNDPSASPQWNQGGQTAPYVGSNTAETGQGLFNSWLANVAHAGTIPGYQQPGNLAKPSASGASAFQGVSPTYISSLLGGTIPQARAVTAGGVPSISAQGVSADPISAALLGATPSTGDITNAISSNLQPQFAQQDQALNEQLANLGIIGGSSTGALAALGRQQQSQLTSDISPYVMQGYELAEQNAQGNQQAYNTAQQLNQANNFATQQLNAGNDLTAQQQNQQTALGLGEFNANATNTSNQYNISNLLQSAGVDANTANNFLASIMGFQNQNWNNLLSSNANLNQAGAAAASGASQPVYQQPSPSSGFANFGSSLAGSFAQPNAVPQTQYQTNYTPPPIQPYPTTSTNSSLPQIGYTGQ